jgi:predicted enzyme related to lactoylglutathione lyase
MGDAEPVEVEGLSWLGVRVADLAAASAFFERLGLQHQRTEGEMAVFSARNGDTVEVFGPGDEDHRHFDTGPVVGFQVDDIEAARRELEADGVEFVGPIGRGGGMAWAHFRGPGGFVYELTARE